MRRVRRRATVAAAAGVPGVARTIPVLLALMAVAAATEFTGAQERSIVIERFESNIEVLPSGDLDVAETITARFTGSWNGIFRDLSLEHRTAEDRRRRLDARLLGASGEDGADLEVDRERRGGWTRRWRIWVPGARDATRTFTLRYRVTGAIRFFDEAGPVGPLDELYWNVTGDDWEVPIEQVVASITIPEGVTPSQSAVYTGPPGSQASDAVLDTEGRTVRAASTRAPFAPGEGLTLAVGWPPGIVPRPTVAQGLVGSAGRAWPLALPFLALLGAFRRWTRHGRDPDPRSIAARYEPPEGLTAAEVGTLIDHRAHAHDLLSTLVDLAVRGYLVIEERKRGGLFGVGKSSEYRFHQVRPAESWSDLHPHERTFLRGLFLGGLTGARGPAGALASLGAALGLVEPDDPEPSELAGGRTVYATVELDDLRNRFYKSLAEVRKEVYAQLVRKGHYRTAPHKVQGAWTAGAIGVLIATLIVAIRAAETGMLGLSPLPVAVAGVGTAGVLFVFSFLMRARTELGARTREAALGFKEFIERVESDRYRRMITSPELFERYLPFAMAFQAERHWAKAFDGLLTEPPGWYSGSHPGNFQPSRFSADLSRMSSAAAQTMSSSPSGSGGGGSSGGGSGGGGGGGF